MHLGQNILYSNGGSLLQGHFNRTGGSNQPAALLSRWQKPGDIAPVQKFSTGTYSNTVYGALSSDAAYADASYLRLKNFINIISTAWSAWKQKAHMQNWRIFLQGQNLLTFTKIWGLDPENGDGFGSALPPNKNTFTVGLQVSLSSVCYKTAFSMQIERL